MNRSREFSILLFTCIAHALTHVYMLIFPSVLDPMRESFGLTRDEFTQYATISTVLFGVGALPAGWLGDRFGEKALLVAFFFLTALGGIVLGLAQGTFLLGAGMALVGLGTSIFHPVGNALISKGTAAPGRAMGLNGLWGSLGTAGGPLYAGIVLAWVDSWRWAYIALSVPMFAFGIALAFTKIETLPEEPPTKTRRLAPVTTGRSALAILLPLYVAMTCGGLYFHFITTMLPSQLKTQSQLNELITTSGTSPLLVANIWTAVIYLIGGAGQLFAGRMVHAREGRGLYVILLTVSTPLVFLMGQLHGIPLVITGGIMALSIFAVQPVENTLLSRYSPPSRRGLLFGMKFVLAFGVGGLGAGISGRVERLAGLEAVFTVAACVTAGALLAALVAWSVRRRDAG